MQTKSDDTKHAYVVLAQFAKITSTINLKVNTSTTLWLMILHNIENVVFRNFIYTLLYVVFRKIIYTLPYNYFTYIMILLVFHF